MRNRSSIGMFMRNELFVTSMGMLNPMVFSLPDLLTCVTLRTARSKRNEQAHGKFSKIYQLTPLALRPLHLAQYGYLISSHGGIASLTMAWVSIPSQMDVCHSS
jgi:hypothetical protein